MRQLRLANDIAVQFRHQPPDVAARSVAAHIRSFWDPRMRAELLRSADHAEGTGTPDADPIVVEALALLRQS